MHLDFTMVLMVDKSSKTILRMHPTSACNTNLMSLTLMSKIETRVFYAT
jgi:hypothetical protein